MNNELCRLCGVQCNMTSAYHPQSNGLDERFNQTLQRQLLKFVESEQNSWDQCLDAILFSYRVSCQDSTKYSPFFLVYGRHPRLPIEFTMQCPGTSECDKPDDGLQQTILECNMKVFYFILANFNFLLVFRQWLMYGRKLWKTLRKHKGGERSIMTKSTAKTGNCMKLGLLCC